MAKIKNKMTFEKTEIVVVDMHPKKPQAHNLTYDQIISIQFDKTQRRVLFKKIDDEQIVLTIRTQKDPIYLYASEEGEFFEGYKEGLAKFAHDNRISFYNNLK